MRYRRALTCLLLPVAPAQLSCGNPVDAVAGLFLEKVPSPGERAVWVGTLKSVTVFSEAGESIPATALRVTKGPLNPPYSPTAVDAAGEPDEMLLVEREERSAKPSGLIDGGTVIDPAQVPIGATVRISGRSTNYPPGATTGASRVSRRGPVPSPVYSRPSRPDDGYIYSERVIRVDGGVGGIKVVSD